MSNSTMLKNTDKYLNVNKILKAYIEIHNNPAKFGLSGPTINKDTLFSVIENHYEKLGLYINKPTREELQEALNDARVLTEGETEGEALEALAKDKSILPKKYQEFKSNLSSSAESKAKIIEEADKKLTKSKKILRKAQRRKNWAIFGRIMSVVATVGIAVGYGLGAWTLIGGLAGATSVASFGLLTSALVGGIILYNVGKMALGSVTKFLKKVIAKSNEIINGDNTKEGSKEYNKELASLIAENTASMGLDVANSNQYSAANERSFLDLEAQVQQQAQQQVPPEPQSLFNINGNVKYNQEEVKNENTTVVENENLNNENVVNNENENNQNGSTQNIESDLDEQPVNNNSNSSSNNNNPKSKPQEPADEEKTPNQNIFATAYNILPEDEEEFYNEAISAAISKAGNTKIENIVKVPANEDDKGPDYKPYNIVRSTVENFYKDYSKEQKKQSKDAEISEDKHTITVYKPENESNNNYIIVTNDKEKVKLQNITEKAFKKLYGAKQSIAISEDGKVSVSGYKAYEINLDCKEIAQDYLGEAIAKSEKYDEAQRLVQERRAELKKQPSKTVTKYIYEAADSIIADAYGIKDKDANGKYAIKDSVRNDVKKFVDNYFFKKQDRFVEDSLELAINNNGEVKKVNITAEEIFNKYNGLVRQNNVSTPSNLFNYETVKKQLDDLKLDSVSLETVVDKSLRSSLENAMGKQKYEELISLAENNSEVTASNNDLIKLTETVVSMYSQKEEPSLKQREELYATKIGGYELDWSAFNNTITQQLNEVAKNDEQWRKRGLLNNFANPSLQEFKYVDDQFKAEAVRSYVLNNFASETDKKKDELTDNLIQYVFIPRKSRLQQCPELNAELETVVNKNKRSEQTVTNEALAIQLNEVLRANLQKVEQTWETRNQIKNIIASASTGIENVVFDEKVVQAITNKVLNDKSETFNNYLQQKQPKNNTIKLEAPENIDLEESANVIKTELESYATKVREQQIPLQETANANKNNLKILGSKFNNQQIVAVSMAKYVIKDQDQENTKQAASFLGSRSKEKKTIKSLMKEGPKTLVDSFLEDERVTKLQEYLYKPAIKNGKMQYNSTEYSAEDIKFIADVQKSASLDINKDLEEKAEKEKLALEQKEAAKKVAAEQKEAEKQAQQQAKLTAAQQKQTEKQAKQNEVQDLEDMATLEGASKQGLGSKVVGAVKGVVNKLKGSKNKGEQVTDKVESEQVAKEPKNNTAANDKKLAKQQAKQEAARKKEEEKQQRTADKLAVAEQKNAEKKKQVEQLYNVRKDREDEKKYNYSQALKLALYEDVAKQKVEEFNKNAYNGQMPKEVRKDLKDRLASEIFNYFSAGKVKDISKHDWDTKIMSSNGVELT